MIFVNKKLIADARATRLPREHRQVTLKNLHCAPDTSWMEVETTKITWYVFEALYAEDGKRRRPVARMKPEEIKTISNEGYLDDIINSGWSIVGPRKDPEKDLRFAKNFFKRGITFFPEHVLQAEGFKIVPPSPLTQGHQLMFKDEGQLVRYTKSRYRLISNDLEIPLYVLLKEDKTVQC
jgi:hypothetical protein